MKWLLLFLLAACLAEVWTKHVAGPFFRSGCAIVPTKPRASHYQPATANDGVRWFVTSTVSPSRLPIVGPINSAGGTLRDVPRE